MSILSIKSVSKSYGDVRALNDVSFEHSGGFCALLGQNGAGKSTLFQLLTGLFLPDEGEITIAGKNLKTQIVEVLSEIGVVFQQPSLDLDMTVEANLLFHGRLRGMKKETMGLRIEEELTRLGLIDDLKRPCRALSGGNRRKVELARALMGNPRLLLMDEATVGLDPASRDSLVKYVYELCGERSMATLWATHLVDEAENADQILVLDKGRQKAEGTAHELAEQSGQTSLLDAFLAITEKEKDA